MQYRADRPRATIAALATAPGPAGVAVVRVSGPDAREVLARVCPSSAAGHQPRRMVLSPVVSPLTGGHVDRALVVFFPGPRSFTGEDVVEIHGHGGVAQSRSLLEAVLAAGARTARPGEFTRRAVEAGRLGLAEAEGLADLVAARSQSGLAAARALMGGALTRRVDTLLEAIEALLAEWEGCLDFPDDVDGPDEANWPDALLRLAGELEGLAATFARGRRLREGAGVVLVGAPNAGKSSLLNALAGYERAIVDAEPGTTRDRLEERLELEGLTVTFMDGAGLRTPTSRAEAAGVQRVREAAMSADVLLAVFDGSSPPGEAEEAVLALVASSASPVIAVLNKADLGTVGRGALEVRLGDRPMVETSALTGEGLDELRRRVSEVVGGGVEEGEVVLTLERHHLAVTSASGHVAEARALVEAGAGLDAAAEELRAARAHLAGIIGRGALPEDLLDRVFARFCIGK